MTSDVLKTVMQAEAADMPIEHVEPMLIPQSDRFVLRTTQNRREDIWGYYKKHQSTYWQAEEIDVAADHTDFEKLAPQEQHFVKHVLAFFAASDGIVNENLCENMARTVQWPEARYFYNFQATMENIHAETYQLLLESIVRDSEEREHLLNAIDTVPCVQRKARWALKWIERGDATFGELLVAFAVVEGIFFSGSFCAIFWLKKRGLMPGLTFSNELISRDENLHCEFACLMFSKILQKPDSDTVVRIVREAVECEEDFVRDALPVSLLGMNADQMITYIRFVADRLLRMLGEEAIFGAENPFDWMHMQSLQGKTNFFEKRVGEYQRAASHGKRDYATDDSF